MTQLRKGRQMPIRPATIHGAPIVTIEKLATAIYSMGRAAVRERAASPERLRATLGLIAQMAEAALESEAWTV